MSCLANKTHYSKCLSQSALAQYLYSKIHTHNAGIIRNITRIPFLYLYRNSTMQLGLNYKTIQ